MENCYEDWVGLTFTHCKEVGKCIPTVVAVEGVCLRWSLRCSTTVKQLLTTTTNSFQMEVLTDLSNRSTCQVHKCSEEVRT